jgi:hypothetical protein
MTWMLEWRGRDGKASLYWSGVDGWVEYEDADMYTDVERIGMSIPKGGRWVEVGEVMR